MAKGYKQTVHRKRNTNASYKENSQLCSLKNTHTQIKTVEGYHCLALMLAKMKMSDNILGLVRMSDEGRWSSLTGSQEVQTGVESMGSNLAISYKNAYALWPRSFTSGNLFFIYADSSAKYMCSKISTAALDTM